MPHSPGEQANEGGNRWKEEQQNESRRTGEISNIICCACVSFLSGAEYQRQDGGGGGCSQPWLHLFYSCCWLTCDIGASPLERGKLLSGKRAPSAAEPPPPSSATTHVCSFLRMLIFPDLHVFIPYMCICIVPFLFPSFFAFHSLSPSASLLCHAGGRLVQKRVNREPSGDIEEPNCLECARVSHTVIIRGTQQRPHGIYVPHCQSHCDPRDSLIINSNLNLTSNADPRDNIVVAISSQKSPLQMLERSCFLPASPRQPLRHTLPP